MNVEEFLEDALDNATKHSLVLTTAELKTLSEVFLMNTDALDLIYSDEGMECIKNITNKLEYAIYVNNSLKNESSHIMNRNEWIASKLKLERLVG